jgi:hypothetical protein
MGKNLFHREEARPSPPGGRIPSEPTRPDLASNNDGDPDPIVPTRPPPPPPPEAVPDDDLPAKAPKTTPPPHAPSKRRKAPHGRIPTPPEGQAIVIKDRGPTRVYGAVGLASAGFLSFDLIR